MECLLDQVSEELEPNCGGLGARSLRWWSLQIVFVDIDLVFS